MDATAETAWAVLGRTQTIDEYADNISRAETDDQDPEMTRRCRDTGGNHRDET